MVRPYSESLRHGETGYLASNAKDWRKYLLRLIDDETARRQMAANAYGWSQTRTIERVLPMWEEAWSA